MNTINIKQALCWLIFVVLVGCAVTPLKPGRSVISPQAITLQQSENPASVSTQTYERTVEPAIRLPDDDKVIATPFRTTEKVTTTIGAAQKDSARDIAAKLSSLKSVVWVGVLIFLFGAASAVYPPLKIIVGSTTTSAVACAAGLALIVLPSLIVGHEILILSVSVGAAILWFFAHRHGELRGKVKTLEGK